MAEDRVARSGPQIRPNTLPTMADVALLAGVSHQTVSRVLNGHPSVSAATRERVQAAVKELDYRRNLAARALVTRRSRLLGVISYDTTLYGPASTLHGIQRAARRAGYFVSVASLKALDRATISDAFDRLAEQGVEGLVVIAPVHEALRALATVTERVPMVVVEGGAVRGLSSVSVDQVAGARLATRHLLDQGVSSVVHVAGPRDWPEAEARMSGWRRELTLAGCAAPTPLRGDWSPASGYAAGRRLVAAGASVEAVFVANDQMALGVLWALHEAGVRVPADVLVVGFDDVPEAAYYAPPLTTVRQDFATVGKRSIELLLHHIGDRSSEPPAVVVQPELVVRRSSLR